MSEQLRDLIVQGHAVIRMENETMQALSTARPRPAVREILKAALEELEALPEFAASNYYVIPYKEKKDDPNSKVVNVEGLSIKAAMVLQRHYRNAMAGAQITGEDDRSFQIQGAALDIENNIRVQRPRTVLKYTYDFKTRQEYRLSDQKMEQKLQSEISKAIRNAVLAIIPEPVKIAYWRRAKELAASGKSSQARGAKPEPLKGRVAKMLGAFGKLKVRDAQILAYLEKEKLSEITEEDLGTLIGVFNAIADGETSVAEAFPAEEKPTDERAEAKKALDSVLGPAPSPAAKAAAEELEALTDPPAGGGPLFGDEGKEPSAEEVLLTAIAEKIREIWRGFPGPLPPTDAEYIQKMLSRSWKVKSWESMQKLSADRIKAGLQQFEKDHAFVLANVKKGGA